MINDAPDNDVDEQIETDKLMTVLSTTTILPRRSSTDNNSDDDGYAPKWTNPSSLSKLILRPSGNMIKLKCQAKGSPEPTWEWTKNGLPIERKLGVVQRNKMAITLEDLIPADNGNYTCNVCNKHGCISFTTKVEVSGKSFRLILKSFK